MLGVLLGVMVQMLPARGADIEPILTRTDAAANLPLVMPVRLVGGGQPRSRVTLRFPDGREVEGAVAAVRLVPPRLGAGGWLPDGPRWEVLQPGEAMLTDDPLGLAWFVIADLPAGVFGQEIWLDGRPVSLRWLSRPALLAMRLGFDAGGDASSPLENPWTSPLPETWQNRPDLRAALRPAWNDPARAWRARLATAGLTPREEDRAVAITPDLLDPGIVEAAGAERPMLERLVEAVSAQAEARWRVALARLWSADAALSLRVRHALAGAGEFEAGLERVVAPVWPADDLRAGALLEMLLDDSLSAEDLRTRTAEWLAGVPETVQWVIDDGVRAEGIGVVPSLGVMHLAAGDAGAILMTGSDRIVRPVMLPTRSMRTLRPDWASIEGGFVRYRIAGETRRAIVDGTPVRVEPPGLATGPFPADWSMSRLIGTPGSAAVMIAGAVPSGLLTADAPGIGVPARCRLLLTVPREVIGSGDAWEARIWIGPFGQSRAVLVVRGGGGFEVQTLAGNGGRAFGEAVIERGLAGDDLLVEITLPADAAEADGLVHLGIEVEDPSGSRHAWPRAMLPWQIEPARRALDLSGWLGELGD